MRAAAFAAAVLTVPNLGQAQTAAFEPQVEDIESLPPGAGRDETFYGCTACHAFKLVAAQGMPRERWDETIQWMIERHKMNPPTPEERTAMLDYLSRNYPPRAPRGGWQNPFAQ
ncbi:MAG: hypothetical protein ACK4MV_07510 [Beijerinckiaceae bacterium]